VPLAHFADPNTARQHLAPNLQAWRYRHDLLLQNVEFVPAGHFARFDLLGFRMFDPTPSVARQTLAATSVLYVLLITLVFVAYAVVFLPAQAKRSPTAMFWAAGICFITIIGTFTCTEIQSGTGRSKSRAYFLTTSQALDQALSMQIRARTAAKSIWAFTSGDNEVFQHYLMSTLASTHRRDIRTTRLIDLANIPLADIIKHIENVRVYLRTLYEIRFCANINYEMLIIDNAEAAIFFRTDDRERRSWIHHADPLHIAFVQARFSALMAESRALPPDVSRMDAEHIRDWLERTRADLLRPVRPGTDLMI
jgi:hypothetical protein